MKHTTIRLWLSATFVFALTAALCAQSADKPAPPANEAPRPEAIEPPPQQPPPSPRGHHLPPPTGHPFSHAIAHPLDAFGPVNTPQAIEQTYQRAITALTSTGGILVVPTNAAQHLAIENNSQQLQRTPAPPAQTKHWQPGPGVTIVEVRPEHLIVHVPPMEGLQFKRVLRLPTGESLQHWKNNPIIALDNQVIHGATSYLDYLQAPVQAGKDQRFYVASTRGLREGQFLNVHEGPGMKGKVSRVYVKAMGYDASRQQHYFVADTDRAHTLHAIAQNKNNVGLLALTQTTHSDEQTYDVSLNRYQYGHGDSYMYFAGFNYMSDIHSAYGDENGVLFGAFTHQRNQPFTAVVDRYDPATGELHFTDGDNAKTLGNSRPLINLNPDCWITQGQVYIVPPAQGPNRRLNQLETQPADSDNSVVNQPTRYTWQNKAYPSTYPVSPHTGRSGWLADLLTLRVSESTLKGYRHGGLIRFTKDAPVTADVVGQFFAITDPSERVHKGYAIPVNSERLDEGHLYHRANTGEAALRWYEITHFQANADGSKDIRIRRHWSGAKEAGSPTLFRMDNYTWDDHERPLRFAIAPGAFVNDVSLAVPNSLERSDFGKPWKERKRPGPMPDVLRLAPEARSGNRSAAFAPGDRVEQAIGPDPFHPIPFRSWMWDQTPSVYPAPVFDVANWGAATRYAAMQVHGLDRTLAEVDERQTRRPAWRSVLAIEAASETAIDFAADVTDAAITFRQPTAPQPIKWHYRNADPAGQDHTASLTVDPATGAMAITAPALAINSSATQLKGLSANATPARNLRGKQVPVPAGSKSVTITFPTPEPDADYAIFLELTWLTTRAITSRTPNSFTIEFADAAPKGATLDWLLVR